MPVIRTLAAVLFASFCILFVLPWFIFLSFVTGRADAMYGLAMNVVRIINKIVGVRVHLEALENIPPGACVFVANHVSNVDPIALFPNVPRRLSVLAKKEFFRIPILSFGMRMVKFVPVDRGDKEAAIVSIDTAVDYLREGYSFAIFAEGTRSPDGRLRQFLKGAAVMAIDAKVPIVPVSIVGTYKMMKKGAWGIRPGTVIIRFGDPISAKEYEYEQRNALISRARDAVAKGLPPEQQPLQ